MPEVKKACHPGAIASRTSKGPRFETYEVSCSDGSVMLARCEMGQCAVRKELEVVTKN